MTSHQQDTNKPDPPSRPDPPNRPDPPEATLSPDEIAHQVFPTAFRGYDADAVRQFLTRIADRIRELEQAGEGTPPSAAPPGFDEVGAEVAGILRAAHESADGQIARAQEQARAITSKAEESTAEMTERAARLTAEAEEKGRIVTERAARLTAEAEEQSRIVTERQRRSLDVLQRTIADLRQMVDAADQWPAEEVIDLTKTAESGEGPGATDQGQEAELDSAGGAGFIHGPLK